MSLPQSSAGDPPSHRLNDEWLSQLTGKRGLADQAEAHNDLAVYLYVVTYNLLLGYSSSVLALRGLSSVDLEELSRDFVQDALQKLSKDGYALLDKFSGEGKFTSWMAQVTRRIVASEIRRPYWRRQVRTNAVDDPDNPYLERVADPNTANPAEVFVQKELGEALDDCLNHLPVRYREAFTTCVIENGRADALAEQRGITANAVYMLVYRARIRLQRCLRKKGFHP